MLFRVALMVLKNVSVDILNCGDEAEAIAILNNFLSRSALVYHCTLHAQRNLLHFGVLHYDVVWVLAFGWTP